MRHPDDEPPLNALPPVVVALAGLIVAIELVFQAGAHGLTGGPAAVGWRLDAVRNFAFSGPVLDWMIGQGRWPPDQVWRFVTYPFVQPGLGDTVMVIVFLLALGKLVGEHFGAVAVLVVFFVSAIFSALAYWLLLDTDQPLFGGYPAVYGLIGTFTFLKWLGLGAAGQSRLGAFQLIAVLVGVQIFFGLISRGGYLGWVGNLAGFAAGFAVSFLLVPGAVTRLRNRLRQR